MTDNTYTAKLGFGVFGRLRLGWWGNVPTLQTFNSNMVVGEEMDINMKLNNGNVNITMKVASVSNINMKVGNEMTLTTNLNDDTVEINIPITES